jgi:hypothetical protein
LFIYELFGRNTQIQDGANVRKKTGVEEICVKGFGISFAKQRHFSFITSEKFVKCSDTTPSPTHCVWVGEGGL